MLLCSAAMMLIMDSMRRSIIVSRYAIPCFMYDTVKVPPCATYSTDDHIC
jgi:hypothetical protein